jgi:fumarate reductase flavoprotein subunit
MSETSETIDIVVVGAGGCGMLASLRAAADGARVLILEKTGAPGGGTAMATRGIRAAGSRVQRAAGVVDDPDLWAADILSRNEGTGDQELTQALTRVSGEMVDFLEEATDIRFKLNKFVFGHNVQRSHTWAEDRAITDFLYDAVRRSPSIEVRFETQVTGLVQGDDGAVLGVRIGDHSILATTTILAAGGFNANYPMVVRYIPKAADIPVIGHPGTDGAVMDMAVAAGAVLDNMDSSSLTPRTSCRPTAPWRPRSSSPAASWSTLTVVASSTRCAIRGR